MADPIKLNVPKDSPSYPENAAQLKTGDKCSLSGLEVVAQDDTGITFSAEGPITVTPDEAEATAEAGAEAPAGDEANPQADYVSSKRKQMMGEPV